MYELHYDTEGGGDKRLHQQGIYIRCHNDLQFNRILPRHVMLKVSLVISQRHFSIVG